MIALPPNTPADLVADRRKTLRGATPDDRFALATRWTLVRLGIPFRVWCAGHAFPTLADRQRFDRVRDARLMEQVADGVGRAMPYDATTRAALADRRAKGRAYQRPKPVLNASQVPPRRRQEAA